MCKKDVTSGYVVCSDCAAGLRSGAMPHDLERFTAWLGAALTRELGVKPCSICGIKNCNNVSRCREGVFAWLRAKAKEFYRTSNTSVLGQLKTVCPFPEVFEDLDTADGPDRNLPRRKIGHIQAKYDGGRWRSTAHFCHAELTTMKMRHEIGTTYDALTAEDALYDLNALCRFCWAHPEAWSSEASDEAYSFYLVGDACDFWVWLVTRETDYNMYLSAYAKETA